jgi:hypothetical protein
MNRRLRPPLAALAFVASLAVTSPARSQTLLVGEVDANRVDILSYSSATNSFTNTGSINGVTFPFGLAFNPAGNGGLGTLYLAGLEGQLYQYNGTTLSTFGPTGGIGQFANAIAVDTTGDASNGHVFVSNYPSNPATGTGSVIEFDSAGNILHTINNANTLPPNLPALDGPTGLVYSAANGGTLFISSSLNNQVDQYNPVTGVLSNYGIGLPNYVNAPAGLTEDPSTGTLYVTNYFVSGDMITPIASGGAVGTNFSTGSGSEPGSVVLGPVVTTGPTQGQSLLISDYGTGTISQYTTSGAVISSNILGGTIPGPVYLDYIATGTVAPNGGPALPEPASFVLLGLGGALGLAYRRRLSRTRPAA